MSKDYKNVTKSTPKTKSKAGSALSFFTGLAIGLLAAVIIYFQEHRSTITPIPQQESREIIASESNDINDSEEQENIELLPEPQFDFYKILPNKEVNISEWETREDEHTDNTPQQSIMYVLQVGSFSQYEAADEIKAELAILGINADIQRVVINGQDIRHRVRIGPYKNTVKLQEARDRLFENGHEFMVLNLKMDDSERPSVSIYQTKD
jgi:cell division protein FtsN